MPAEGIIQKILSDAKTEAHTIETEFQKEVEKIKAEQDREIEKITASAKEEGKIEGEEKARRLLSNAEMSAKKSLLQLKQELIDEVFQSAYDRVRNMEPKAYQKFMHDLILKVVETGDEEIVVGNKDAKLIDRSFIEQINHELKKEGKKGELQCGKPYSDIDGGVVLRHGRKEINATLLALFHEARQELESEVAGILLQEKQ